MIKHITTVNEFNSLLKSEENQILVDFYATWCGPCNMLTPTIEKLENQYPELVVVKVDVDQARELASMYHVEAIPTLLLIENNDIVDRKMGYLSESQLKKFLRID